MDRDKLQEESRDKMGRLEHEMMTKLDSAAGPASAVNVVPVAQQPAQPAPPPPDPKLNALQANYHKLRADAETKAIEKVLFGCYCLLLLPVFLLALVVLLFVSTAAVIVIVFREQ